VRLSAWPAPGTGAFSSLTRVWRRCPSEDARGSPVLVRRCPATVSSPVERPTVWWIGSASQSTSLRPRDRRPPRRGRRSYWERRWPSARAIARSRCDRSLFSHLDGCLQPRYTFRFTAAGQAGSNTRVLSKTPSRQLSTHVESSYDCFWGRS